MMKLVSLWIAALAVGQLSACPMCLAGRTLSVSAQELVYAKDSVLALAGADGESFQVVAVIKGGTQSNTVISEKVLKFDRIAGAGNPMPFLLIRDESWPNWVNFGRVSVKAAPALKSFADTRRSTELDDAGWVTHVATFFPYLENPDPMIATIADAELSSAPYTALRSLKPQLNPAELRQSLADPELATRAPLFIILLGISGDHQNELPFQMKIEEARRTNDATLLGPHLAAMLELRGSIYVDWIEKNYLRDPQRSASEIDAVLLALGEHGKADVAVSRDRVVAAFRSFLTANPDKAGLVASLLADWQRWEFTQSFETLIESRTALPTTERYAVLDFIMRSQQADRK